MARSGEPSALNSVYAGTLNERHCVIRVNAKPVEKVEEVMRASRCRKFTTTSPSAETSTFHRPLLAKHCEARGCATSPAW
jgi:hypothetical protein